MVYRIILVVEHLRSGGVARVVTELSKLWVADGHSVCILSFEDSQQGSFYEIENSVEIKRLGDPRTSLLKTIRSLRKELKNCFMEDRPNFVLGFLPHMNFYSALATRGLPCQFIATEHLYPKFEFHQRSFGMRFCANLAYRFADALVVLTKDSKDCYPKSIQNKIDVIPNPTTKLSGDQCSLKNIPDNFILSVGRLSKQKRFDLLLSAFQTVCHRVNDWQLIIIGDGPLRSELEQQSKNLAINDRVIFGGQTKGMASIYSKAKIFAMASDFEGWSLVLAEALSYGIPSIHTDCKTGPSDMIRSGENGFLVPCGDSKAVAQAMLKLVQSSQLRNDFGKKAKQGSKAFTWENIKPLWEDLFEKCRKMET